MSPQFRLLAGLVCTWLLGAQCESVSAQQPFAPRTAPQNPHALLPQERAFLELEVDLGKPAPFPWQTPVPSVQAPRPREVARQDAGPPPTSPTPQPIMLGTVNWRRDFESAKRRPIETVVFGKGTKHIVVLSNLNGNSEATVNVVERLAGVFARDELMPVQLSVMVVRTPNPDGQAERLPTNSRGVDLNRNFPSTRFMASPPPEAGEKPGSEPETRAVMQLLNRFNPVMVVHVVESRSSRGTVRSDDMVPRELLPQFDSAPFDKVYKAGSLAGYVHETMKCSIVELELPMENTPLTEENTLLQLMVTTLEQSVRSLRPLLAPGNSLARSDTSTSRSVGLHPDGLRGNVEFLPPPPDSPPAPSTARYIELPPPPL